MKTSVIINAHPASDGKTLKILREAGFEAEYAGGVSHGGYRIVMTSASFDEALKLLHERKNLIQIYKDHE